MLTWVLQDKRKRMFFSTGKREEERGDGIARRERNTKEDLLGRIPKSYPGFSVDGGKIL